MLWKFTAGGAVAGVAAALLFFTLWQGERDKRRAVEAVLAACQAGTEILQDDTETERQADSLIDGGLPDGWLRSPR